MTKFEAMARQWLWLLALALALPGCTRFVDTIGPESTEDEHALYGAHTIGQTFTCHHAGLEGIGVWIDARSGGQVVLHLREGADDTEDLAIGRASLPSGGGPAFYYFAIPRQERVKGKTLFVLLESPEASKEGSLAVPYHVDRSLTVGMLYLDGQARPGHVFLQLHYSTLSIVIDLGRQMLGSGGRVLWLLVLALLASFLPGGAAVVWLLKDGSLWERVAVAAGLSVAINALLMYATMSGLRLGRAAVWAYFALCGSLVAWKWREMKWGVPSLRGAWQCFLDNPTPALMLPVLASVLAVRLLAVRGLVAPMWGDSYQHSMIVQLLVDNGGLFDSWAPYAPLDTFTYHFGFHANVALFHWLSGDSVLHSVTFMGQVLNALAVLALYPLAVKVADGNHWAGVGGALTAGLLSTMPMYYVNWGRYTQLGGHVILPVLAWLTWRVAEGECADWREAALAVAAAVGLGVTHYRVVMFYGVFVVALGAATVLRSWRHKELVGRFALRLAAIAIATMALFAPWWSHVSGSAVTRVGARFLQIRNWAGARDELRDALSNWPLFTPALLVVGGSLGLVLSAFRRRLEGGVIALWGAGMLLLANPYLVGLPGAGIVNNLSVFIAFYLPLSVLAGVAFGEAAMLLWRHRLWGQVSVLAVVLVASGWGAVRRMHDVNRAFAMVTPADMEAMSWIRDNTPADALFLVNEFSAYYGTAVVGADAGWWLPLLAGRRNTVPPLNYWMEKSVEPGLHRRLRDDLAYLQKVTPTSQAGVEFLRSRGVTHVYVGQKGGTVGNPGPPLLDVEKLRQSGYYRSVYHKDGVWVFALNGSGR